MSWKKDTSDTTGREEGITPFSQPVRGHKMSTRAHKEGSHKVLNSSSPTPHTAACSTGKTQSEITWSAPTTSTSTSSLVSSACPCTETSSVLISSLLGWEKKKKKRRSYILRNTLREISHCTDLIKAALWHQGTIGPKEQMSNLVWRNKPRKPKDTRSAPFAHRSITKNWRRGS